LNTTEASLYQSVPIADVVASYQENGFVVCPDLISESELKSLRSEVERLLASPPSGFESCYFYTNHHGGGERDTFLADDVADAVDDNDAGNLKDSHESLSRIDSFLPFSPTFLRLLGHPSLLGLMDALLGHDFVVVSESLVFKIPRTGVGFRFHQDGEWLLGENNHVPRGLNVGVYLHDSTEATGCLRAVPAKCPQGKLDITQSGVTAGAQNIPANAGDIIIHSRDLVHGSSPNRSDATRVTCYFTALPRTLAEAGFGRQAVARRTQIIPLAIQSRAYSGASTVDGALPYVYEPLVDRFDCPTDLMQIESHPSLSLPAMHAV